MRNSLLFIAALLTASAASAIASRSDWDATFGAGVLPDYPLQGRLEVVHIKADSYLTYTDSQGQTTSVECNSDSTRTDCWESAGVLLKLPLPNGTFAYISNHVFDDLRAPFAWRLELPNLLSKEGHLLKFRWKADPIAGPGGFLCIQTDGLPDLTSKKEAKKYAHKHRMEACYAVSIGAH